MKTNLLDQPHLNQCLSWLDWDHIVDSVESYMAYDRSKFILRQPPKSKDLEQVVEYYDKLSLTVQWVAKGDGHELAANLRSIPATTNIETLLKKLKLCEFLDLEGLHQLTLQIELLELLISYLIEVDFLELENWDSSKAQSCKKLLRRIVNKDGEINLNGHPELSRLNSQINIIELKIRETLNFLKNSDKYASSIQFEGIDLVNQRYVLPLKSDHYKADFGKILGHSTSGNTLYVEPREIQDLCQKRLLLISLKDELLFKITSEINKEFQGLHFSLLKARQALIEFDLLLAKAFYSNEMEFMRPEFSDDSSWSVTKMFHPLIKDAIPNNFHLDDTMRGLIVSGPNTGGKTVALKTLALISLFPHFGLFVPAAEATIPLHEGIFYLSHDNQDIESGLSSFSSEVVCLVNLFESLCSSNIIFIDEIFNSTSSEEASALAIGVIDKIHELSKSQLVISTHHQSLKVLLSQNSNYESAHVGFDEEKQAPTYKLHFGSPGHSLAFNIFESLTRSIEDLQTIPAKAKEIIGSQQMDYEKMLSQVSHKMAELDTVLEKSNEIQTQLKNQKDANEGLLRLKREEILQKYKEDFEHTKTKILDRIEEQLKSDKPSRKAINRALDDLGRKTNQEESQDIRQVPAKFKAVQSFEYQVGDQCYSTLLKKEVIIESVDKTRSFATVKLGRLSYKTPIKTLLKNIHSKPVTTNKIEVNIEIPSEENIEIDCRGMRLEEFQNRIDMLVKDLRIEAVPFFQVIHGIGNGILRKWLNTYLEKETEFFFESPPEYQGGVTIIYSKKKKSSN